VIGYGPGQSSIKLAAKADAPPAVLDRKTPLQSAQGLWAASLIDTGLLGFASWIVFLVAVFVAVFQGLPGTMTIREIGVVVAALGAVAASELEGDRLELRVWMLLGIALAAALRNQHEKGQYEQR
jgi:hypothetical protein